MITFLFQNTFPVSGLFSIHLLSLDALLTVIESIERNCHSRMQSEHQESAASVSVITKSGRFSPKPFIHVITVNTMTEIKYISQKHLKMPLYPWSTILQYQLVPQDGVMCHRIFLRMNSLWQIKERKRYVGCCSCFDSVKLLSDHFKYI